MGLQILWMKGGERHEILCCYRWNLMKISNIGWVMDIRKKFCAQFNPIRCNVWETEKSVGGGRSAPPPLENHEGVVRDPMLLFRSWSYIKMELTWKKIGSKSQKLVEISRFENLMKLRFRLGMTQKNTRNSLIFWDKGLIYSIIFILHFKIWEIYKTWFAAGIKIRLNPKDEPLI